MLTDLKIRKAIAQTKPVYLNDGDGLYLKVALSGTKTWMVRSQAGGKTRWKSLGRYPTLGLAEARKLAETPFSALMTVQGAFDQYKAVLQRDYEHPEQIIRRFTADVLPSTGLKPLIEVKRTEVSELLQDIVQRGSPVAANRTLPDLKNFFDWCVERGWIEHNPAALIRRRSVGGKEKPRARVLTLDECGKLIGVLRSGRFAEQTSVALALLLLTGQRASEVLGMSGAEVVGPWWTIPAERTKAGRDQKVYLTRPARTLWRYITKKHGTKPFDMDHRTLSKAVRRMNFSPPFTPHDLRRSMATQLAEVGVAGHVVEKMLNHRMEGVMAVYNHAEYLPERRLAWRVWAKHLMRVSHKDAELPLGQQPVS